MAHFAQLDENNVVLQVIVVNNSELLDENGQESEERGVAFCKSLFGVNTLWVQTSYNGTFRGSFAGQGFVHVPESDVFIEPSPGASWTLQKTPAKWVPPVPYPEDAIFHLNWALPLNYSWDEDNQSWVALPPPENPAE